MKNQMIHDAYDALNPDPASVERMCRRLQEVLPEEKEHSRNYVAKPEKYNHWSVLAATAACLAVLIAGCILLPNLSEGNQIQESQPVQRVQPDEPGVMLTANDVYGPVLEKYETALLERWDQQRCSDEMICKLTQTFQLMPEKLGAAFLDLDEDGREELLITDGNYIYDLYTWKGDSAVKLLTASAQVMMRLCDDHSIFSEALDASGNPVYVYSRITSEGVEYVEQVTQVQSSENGIWTVIDRETGKTVPVTGTEALNRIDSYTQIAIPFAPIVTASEKISSDTPFGPGDYDDYVARIYGQPRYQDGLLDIYATYYTLYDLNNDGILDLLIGNRDGSISEAVTCIDEELRLLFNVGRDFRVCENGALITGIEGDSNYVIYRLSGQEHFVSASIWMDEGSGQWYLYLQQIQQEKEISEQDALDILESYRAVKLDMTLLLEYPMGE